MIFARHRSARSHLSGASTSRLPIDAPEIPRQVAASEPSPAAHELLVALVSTPEHRPTGAVSWPLWLVPGAMRRASRDPSRAPRSPIRE
ncbi:MAG TPA: hypothetical protein VGV64_02765 [Thermoplasmata archaeon]|nr:hypothetical protein [Thermoplasmata archaeon]HEV2428752.1 hypothetical protein [Thermoplasmata archaeon]